MADRISGLARIDPDQFAISLCTVDGQRHGVGDADFPFSVEEVSETVSHCMAWEEHGVDVTHRHIGREPTGRGSGEFALDRRSGPRHPVIDSGALLSCALIRPELPLADRFEQVALTWQRLAGGRRVGVDESGRLSARQRADREVVLGRVSRESGALPPGTDLSQALDLYFRCCAVELDARTLAVVAAALANGGVCPLTDDRVFGRETVRHCLSLMSSCGMDDFSGEFAFTIGLPAKSGVSGALMVVVPGLMGVCVWSPRLDELGNSVRGIEFCRQLVKRFEVRPPVSVVRGARRKDPRKRPDQSAAESVVALCWAASQGDLDEVRRLASVAGTDLSTGDYDGRTPLHLAAAEGHVEVTGYLLAHGANPAATDRWGGTALTDARRGGHTRVAELLDPHTPVDR
ncbi:glutaminase [Streptomyces sp. NPDC091280]|uniref:glutaminase n=1 Tax=Streptomyces sp. NPDC091280 TaxID=3365984 RepID=UPI003828BB89